MLNETNWTFCHYKSGLFTASISLAGSPEANEGVKITYFLNKYNEKQLIFQEEFHSIDDALIKANKTYSSWEFVDLEKNLQNGGCSTCQAHE